MIKIEVGQRYKDNDPRMQGRIVTVVGFEQHPSDPYRTKAICKDSIGKKFRIDTLRMHVTEKPRRSGFSLISDTLT